MKGRGWAAGFLGAIAVVALLADVLTGDRPLMVINEGSSDELSIWPLIPYEAVLVDLSEPGLLPPLSIGSNGRHWLGTDPLGRDTAAGVVAGTRIAVLVGLGSLLIALVIGIPLGAVAGFYGDEGMKASRYTLYACLLGLPLGVIYTFTSLGGADIAGEWLLLSGLLVTACLISILWIALKLLSKLVAPLKVPVGVPFDRVVLFMLELTVSIPRLVLLIGLLSFAYRPSLWTVVLVIGLLGWTPVARFLRGELLRIRELPYIDAARIGGVGEIRLLLGHALPNAIGPVAVVAAFMVGGSILAEAMLSFLGLGVPAEQVTWGSLLQQSRANPTAWWLAVFPGVLLTLTVLACNSLRGKAGDL